MDDMWRRRRGCRAGRAFDGDKPILGGALVPVENGVIIGVKSRPRPKAA